MTGRAQEKGIQLTDYLTQIGQKFNCQIYQALIEKFFPSHQY
ncbi:41765_t:CDS:2, partial [Gigaspora margarita]